MLKQMENEKTYTYSAQWKILFPPPGSAYVVEGKLERSLQLFLFLFKYFPTYSNIFVRINTDPITNKTKHVIPTLHIFLILI